MSESARITECSRLMLSSASCRLHVGARPIKVSVSTISKIASGLPAIRTMSAALAIAAEIGSGRRSLERGLR